MIDFENYSNVLIISFRLQPKILNTSVQITVFFNSCISSADALVHILPAKDTPWGDCLIENTLSTCFLSIFFEIPEAV